MAGEAGKGHDSKSMRRRKPPRRRSWTNKRSMAWRRGLDPTSGRENRQPGPRQYLKCGDGLLRLFCSSTCWLGLTRTSLSWVEDPTHAARRGTSTTPPGIASEGNFPILLETIASSDRQTDSRGETQQRGERETQKGPRGVVSRASSSINREGRTKKRERVAVACANGAMQARDSSTRQRIKALLHVQSISLCSVSPPPPSPPSLRDGDRGWVCSRRNKTDRTGAACLLAGDDVWVRRNVTSGPQVESGRCSQTRLGLPIDDWARFYRMATPQPGQDGAS